MLFTSALFITVFLPGFLCVYYWRPRNAVALAFSLLFYAWGAPRFLPIVLAAGAINYFLSLGIAAGRRKPILLTIGILLHLGILLYYKYLMFFVSQINDWFPGHALPLPLIVLPLGVSFITFEQISYLMDVYRGDCRPAAKLSDYYLFLLLFPHSIAGPIFRWKDLQPQIQARSLEDEKIFSGFVRFIYGLGKKALVANFVAFPADQIFGLPAEQIGFHVAWIAAVSYSLQIYFDFSAYSDMAIGIGQMAGFSFKENFAFPYVARSISEFWERWHISLTSWFRNYLYIPLGGNRVSPARTYVNILVVFAVSGFWHGSSWNFLFWGIYHGVIITLERAFGLGTKADSSKIGWRTLPTLILVMIGWILFRAKDFTQALVFLRAMSGFSGNPLILQLPIAQICPYRSMFMILFALALVPAEPRIYAWLSGRLATLRGWAFASVVFVLSLAAVANSSYNPFIYFRF